MDFIGIWLPQSYDPKGFHRKNSIGFKSSKNPIKILQSKEGLMHADSVKLSVYIHIQCNKQYLLYLPRKKKVKMEASLAYRGKQRRPWWQSVSRRRPCDHLSVIKQCRRQ
jgi:hypothetical protein